MKIGDVNDILLEDQSLHTIDHKEAFMYNGRLNGSLYKDSIHPNQRGLSRIIYNIKNEINNKSMLEKNLDDTVLCTQV